MTTSRLYKTSTPVILYPHVFVANPDKHDSFRRNRRNTNIYLIAWFLAVPRAVQRAYAPVLDVRLDVGLTYYLFDGD